jgi:hypothetical protein
MDDLLAAAREGNDARLRELLVADLNITLADSYRFTVPCLAAIRGQYVLVRFWLAEGEGCFEDFDYEGLTIWEVLRTGIEKRRDYGIEETNVTDLSKLLKVMVMLDDAPQFFISLLTPHHGELCTRGRLLRAQLPLHLEQQRASVIMHCPLPTVLQSLVADFAATTPEDMWTDGLCVREPRAKRPREEVAAGDSDEKASGPRLRRSLRLQEKHA